MTKAAATANFILVALLATEPARAALPAEASTVREPAVAGLFYPKDPTELSGLIQVLITSAKYQPEPGELKALICPHAGYDFAGPVEGYAYKLLRPHEFETVVVLGPSHYADFPAASVTDAALFRTPLGDVPISAKARVLAKLAPYALEPRCEVQRPDWWSRSSRSAPAVDTADTWEHSVEVEVPFLQYALGNFQIVPVVMGTVDPARAARQLERILDDHTLLIASSDLSHYLSYAQGRELDLRCVDSICRLDISAARNQEACGLIPIMTLMRIAKDRGWQPRLLDYRNSGDLGGDKERVVGYASIAFFGPPSPNFDPAERAFLLGLAHRAVREAASGKALSDAPAQGYAPKFTESHGCFVTLTEHGDLRGCIGTLSPGVPLYRAVRQCARGAAVSDPRFSPVEQREAPDLKVEVSILSDPLPLEFGSPEDLLDKLVPGMDGVMLVIGDHSANFLPDVWKQFPDRADFLDHLCEKAGCEPSAWRKPGMQVFLYRSESFSDPGD